MWSDVSVNRRLVHEKERSEGWKPTSEQFRSSNERISRPPAHLDCVFEERCDLDIQRLRRETEADHLAVEGSVPLMDEGLDTAQYVRCLRRIHGVVAAWEDRAAEIAPEWLQAKLAARQRTSLLERDLTWFGATCEGDPRPALPAMDTGPALLGTMYVMEGSTLGGQLIARHVEAKLHLSEGLGDSYFRGHGDRTGQMWKEFCEVLTTRVEDDRTDEAVTAAKAMFTTFGEWMRERSVMDVK
jgi:heme oxygenase